MIGVGMSGSESGWRVEWAVGGVEGGVERLTEWRWGWAGFGVGALRRRWAFRNRVGGALIGAWIGS